MPGYSDDLSYIHDAGFGSFARGAAPALLRQLRAHGITGGLVVDLGCGSGIWAAELLRAGYAVLGVDISPGMLRLARRRAPGAKFVTASLLDFEVPPCAAVTSIGECVNYTFDPNNSRRTLERLFRRIYSALCPGGVFLFDFAEPGQIPDSTRRQKYTAGPDWAVLLDAREDKQRGVYVRRMISFRQIGTRYRRTDEIHTARLYRSSELLAALRTIGFRARSHRCYGAMPLRPAHAAIVAVKPVGR